MHRARINANRAKSEITASSCTVWLQGLLLRSTLVLLGTCVQMRLWDGRLHVTWVITKQVRAKSVALSARQGSTALHKRQLTTLRTLAQNSFTVSPAALRRSFVLTANSAWFRKLAASRSLQAVPRATTASLELNTLVLQAICAWEEPRSPRRSMGLSANFATRVTGATQQP